MIEEKDFIFIKKAYKNELLSTGFIRKASVFFTPNHVFVLPYDASFHWALESFSVTSEGFDVESFVDEVIESLSEYTLEEFEVHMLRQIPSAWQFEIKKLKIFSQSNWLKIFGTLKLKREIGDRKILYTSSRKINAIRGFYSSF